MDVDSDATTENPQLILVTVKGDPHLACAVPRVELDLSKFNNGRWALQLDAAFARRRAPAVILAQGVACLAVAWWAQLSPRSYLDAVRGALFRSPLNIGFGQAAIAASARTGPLHRLPFPSVVASDVTPYVEQLLALADGWGSRFVDLSAPLSGHPSNRHAVGTDAEDRLLGYLSLLDQGAARDEKPPAAAVSPRVLLHQD
jgi:predicted alpha/beta hydrolase family esterase